MFVLNVRDILYVILMIAAVFFAYAYIVYPDHLRRSVILAPLLTGPGALFVIHYTLDAGQSSGILRSPLAWAYLLASTAAVSVALLAANFAWPDNYEEQGYFSERKWFWVALAVGIAVAAVWNLAVSMPFYRQAGHADLMGSPSYIWRAWVVVPVFMASLINYGLPVVIRWFRSRWVWPFVAALATYGVLLFHDSMFHTLIPGSPFSGLIQAWASVP